MTRWSPHVEPCPPGGAEPRPSRCSTSGFPIAAALDADRRGPARKSHAARSISRVSGSPGIAPGHSAGPGTYSAGRIIGALLTQALAGRAAAVWAPEVVPSVWRAATAAALVRSALADLQARGFRIVQAVLDESASRRGADRPDPRRHAPGHRTALPRARHQNPPASQPWSRAASEAPPRLRWRSFEPAHEAEFRALLQATYASSLDMPELEGVRSLDDIIEGHRATGRFVPDRWRLGQVPGEPEAAVVLLLSDIPDRDVWEVVYLGLTASRPRPRAGPRRHRPRPGPGPPPRLPARARRRHPQSPGHPPLRIGRLRPFRPPLGPPGRVSRELAHSFGAYESVADDLQSAARLPY